MLLDFEDKTKKQLIIKGNWLQALGGFTAIGDGFENLDPGESINVVANILQGLGNSLQALGGIEELRNKDDKGETLGIAGSWIQTVGSVMSAIEQTKETDT